MLNEIVPHYLDVKEIYIDGKLKNINLRNLKEESKKIVRNLLLNDIYPVIPDLYRSKQRNLPSYPRATKYYSIKLDSISRLHLKETEKIQEFLRNTFFRTDGVIAL